jgi:NADH:ubiquinone oxidoreductase subunit K
VVHAYRSTGLLIPASTHGGRQLWFGTLQTGPYFDNWLANPRSVLESPFIDYTSLDEVPFVVSGRVQPCAMDGLESIELRYWTSRDPAVRRVQVASGRKGTFELSIDPQPAPVAVSYYFVVRAVRNGQPVEFMTPERGPADPRILAVTRDHLGDLDVASQWLDVFDVIRLTRHVLWREALPSAALLDLNHDGVSDEHDLRRAATLLADPSPHTTASSLLTAVEEGAGSATLRFVDGSTLEIPREWDGRISSTVVRGDLAARVATRSRTFASLMLEPAPHTARVPDIGCLEIEDAGINRVLRRYEPQEMRRAMALALDNIRREPGAFAVASLKRALRLFLVEGGVDRTTTVQFAHSPTVYRVARTVSIAYFGLFVCGVILAIVRRHRLLVLLAPIVYIPATICPMLVTSRYSTTMQPFIFVFMAIALVEAHDFIGRRRAAGTSTATGSLR